MCLPRVLSTIAMRSSKRQEVPLQPLGIQGNVDVVRWGSCLLYAGRTATRQCLTTRVLDLRLCPELSDLASLNTALTGFDGEAEAGISAFWMVLGLGLGAVLPRV